MGRLVARFFQATTNDFGNWLRRLVLVCSLDVDLTNISAIINHTNGY